MVSDQVYIGSPTPWIEPSYEAVAAFISACEEEGVHVRPLSARRGRLLTHAPCWSVLRSIRRPNKVIVPLMGARFSELAAAATQGSPVIFAWDVWEPEFDIWKRAIERYGVEYVFVTNSTASTWLSEALPSVVVRHIPEAIRIGRFPCPPRLCSRSIDVLEMGRRHEPWHQAVTTVLAHDSRVHVYRSNGTGQIWQTPASLDTGLMQTAVSVCFPRSVTHPGVAGSVETLTQRYLESMAAGCVVLGHCPAELERLVGYNPVVEVEWASPASQISGILDHLDDYQELVDRNVAAIASVGGWSQRIGEILLVLGGDRRD